MLTKETVIDRAEVLEDGQIQVREVTRILEDGVTISESFHRYVLDPAHDTPADVTAKVADKGGVPVETIANTVWTDEVVTARQEAVAAQPTPPSVETPSA